MAEITLDQLTNPKAEEKAPDRGVFKAETLRCTITRPNGEVVAECDMPARAFSPSEKTGKGGIGWYADLSSRKENSGSYRGVAVSAGLRLSVEGLKISAGDTVNLMPDQE